MTGADRSPVRDERLIGTTNSVNQTPSPLVCLIISSRLGESMKTNTFVTRMQQPQPTTAQFEPPIRQKTERNVRYNLPSVPTHDNRKFTMQTGIRACAAQHFCGKLELVIHCYDTINLWLFEWLSGVDILFHRKIWPYLSNMVYTPLSSVIVNSSSR